MAQDPRASGRERQAYFAETHNHYREKDKSTLQLLRLIDFKDVEAYYVNVKSSHLKCKLIEIVIHNPDVLTEISSPANSFEQELLILHTKNPMIAEVLRRNGVLREDRRKSLADGYINQKY